MAAPRKYDQEFRGPGGADVSRPVGRGERLDAGSAAACGVVVGPESGDAAELGRGTPSVLTAFKVPAALMPAEFEEVRALTKRVAELERANEILKTSAAFSPQAEFDCRCK
jgi:transposase